MDIIVCVCVCLEVDSFTHMAMTRFWQCCCFLELWCFTADNWIL